MLLEETPSKGCMKYGKTNDEDLIFLSQENQKK